MGKPIKRSRDEDEDEPLDEDEDRPRKKAKKKKKKGGNTMLIVLGIGGVACVGLLCVCGGLIGGYSMGWFGGADQKGVAKAAKDGDKQPEGGTPKGTGPLVTSQNFEQAARDFKTLADAEKLLGPGLPLKGADAEMAAKNPAYKFLRDTNPNAKAYQWSNSQEVYYIFYFDGDVYMGHGRNPNTAQANDKGPNKGDKGPDKGATPKLSYSKIKNGMPLAQVEKILGPGRRLMGADLSAAAAQFKALQILRATRPTGDTYQWTAGNENYFVLIDRGIVIGKARQ